MEGAGTSPPAMVAARLYSTSATAHVRAGNIDQAADLGILAAEQATRVRSSRVAARVSTLIGLLTAHRALPQAARFLESVADLGHRSALARELR